MIAIKLEGYCYCGKKIKIKYDEEKGIKDTVCPKCKYNHMDSIYHYMNEAKEFIKDCSRYGEFGLT